LAKGRRPDDDDTDNFPDYNRLEMRPKPKEPQNTPPVADTPKPVSTPSLNTPVNPGPTVDDTVPQPPPKVVPLPDSASEPPMPDDIKDTLDSSTTNQK
jgi:hypothetical protein